MTSLFRKLSMIFSLKRICLFGFLFFFLASGICADPDSDSGEDEGEVFASGESLSSGDVLSSGKMEASGENIISGENASADSVTEVDFDSAETIVSDSGEAGEDSSDFTLDEEMTTVVIPEKQRIRCRSVNRIMRELMNDFIVPKIKYDIFS